MPPRLITPSQLSLFSISPVIGAWWEELKARKLFKESKPDPSELEKQLRLDGERHEKVLLGKLEAKGHSIVDNTQTTTTTRPQTPCTEVWSTSTRRRAAVMCHLTS